MCRFREIISGGDYELEVMGRMIKATADVKTPFDPKNLRAQGDYSEDPISVVNEIPIQSSSQSVTSARYWSASYQNMKKVSCAGLTIGSNFHETILH